MYQRNLLIARWTLFAGAALAAALLQLLPVGGLLGWSVRPFLLPLVVAVAASYEDATASALFALGLGLCADALLLPPLPCCYTLAFPGAALLCNLFSRRVISPGPLRSLTLSLLTYGLVDGLMMLYLATQGASGPALLQTAAGELALSLPFLLVVHPLCLSIHRRCLAD